jgi:hypothetical protein
MLLLLLFFIYSQHYALAGITLIYSTTLCIEKLRAFYIMPSENFIEYNEICKAQKGKRGFSSQ